MARGGGGNGSSTGIGSGGAGGTVTGANATATSLSSTSGQATAKLTSLGGAGGAGQGSGYYGGAGANVAGGTAAATGFNASAYVLQDGGAGGDAGNGAGGGAGGSSTLTNAVSGATLGGTLSLFQNARGGAGGYARGGTGAGGAGGSATSSLTFSDLGNTVAASKVTGSSYAYGGYGNNSDTSASLGGLGGAGTAAISLTAFNTVNATANAYAGADAGEYGGPTVGDGNAIATAQAISTGPTGTATATANAKGGPKGPYSPLGDASATATAETADGQLATANASGNGTSGTVQSNAETSGTGLVSAVTVSASTPVATSADAEAQAEYSSFNSGLSGWNGITNVAYATAMPTGSVASYGGYASNVMAAFAGPTAKLLGADTQVEVGTQSSGTQQYQSTVSYTLNSTNLPGDLYAGLLESKVTGNGFESLTFSIDVGGVQVVDQNFTSVSAAEAYFQDDAVDLGAAPASTDLIVSLNFDLTAATYGNGFGVEALFGVACYCSGTRIATPHGEITVEALRVGDLVTTADGAARPVRWIGHRSMECGKHQRPQDAWPVRVSAGSFREGAPQRDLCLSPDHAVFARGVLIPIKHLINGATITQEPRDVVTYWHVELDRHDVILAEGLPCETYLDTGNRAMFVNGPVVTLHPSFARTADQAWTKDACAPLVEDGAILTAVQEALASRALEIGKPVAAIPSIEIEAAGRVIMVVPAGADTLRLVSRSDRRGDDRRRLGALIRGLRIDGASVVLHDERLGCGFHEVEDHGAQTVRWTNGKATLALGRSEHDRMVEIDVAAVIAEMPEQRIA